MSGCVFRLVVEWMTEWKIYQLLGKQIGLTLPCFSWVWGGVSKMFWYGPFRPKESFVHVCVLISYHMYNAHLSSWVNIWTVLSMKCYCSIFSFKANMINLYTYLVVRKKHDPSQDNILFPIPTFFPPPFFLWVSSFSSALLCPNLKTFGAKRYGTIRYYNLYIKIWQGIKNFTFNLQKIVLII